MIGANPDNYYYHFQRPGIESDQPRPNFFTDEALADYLRSVHNPATIHAMCEDYRAGATYDLELDEADRGKKRIQCPLLVLWGGKGEVGKWYDMLAVWRDWADTVEGHAIENSGHYIEEEAPDETYAAFYKFFS